MKFELTERAYGECYVVAVAGEIDIDTAPAFRERLLRAEAAGYRVVIADLSPATFVDSSAANALISLRKRLVRRGAEMVVVADEESILQVFALTGLDGVFTIVADLSAALRLAGCSEADAA